MKKWTRREFIPLTGMGLVAGGILSCGAQIPSDSKDKLLGAYTKPDKLRHGDTVGICAPAGALRSVGEIDEFRTILEDFGFRVKVGPNCTKKYGYFAGTDEERAADFMQFVEDTEVKGIFFLRGGWGCARLLPHLHFDTIEMNPKIIMGFSDATTLLNAITTRSSLITYHGPSGNSSWNDYTRNYFRKTLMDGELVLYRNQPQDQEIITYSEGTAEGLLWGGNLTVLTSLIGTDALHAPPSGLLFLEDVSEEPYSIDRMLTQLKQSGILDTVNGVVLGNFRKCIAEEPERSFTLEEVFEQHFSNLGKPVFYGAQIGHTVNKFTIPVGIRAKMNANSGTVQLLESPVA